MDIEITNPVNIKLDVIEFDEHVPSLKFSVSISVEKFGYKAEVNTHFWIECQCFDKFVSCMNCGELAILKDMNDSFELILNPVAGVLNWSCMKEDAYFHERRSLNNFHRDRVITFEQIAE
ncbi:hypothetical protein [Escherichia coli]|uniref:Uncharacterized protein n=1 Tax=Escherichia coli TaxID=562 RepID=A0AAP7TVJ0_ECOLX|nr:hypothetical protein [Escherichia coli]OKB73136.1 hypothetical protein BMT50_10355 [Escherichia coli]OKB84841.1 hypothetical protein BMT52_07935 [Escherichia coli]OKB93673.1 hypothetical protein BMT51_03790 [Escherichia coli]